MCACMRPKTDARVLPLPPSSLSQGLPVELELTDTSLANQFIPGSLLHLPSVGIASRPPPYGTYTGAGNSCTAKFPTEPSLQLHI